MCISTYLLTKHLAAILEASHENIPPFVFNTSPVEPHGLGVNSENATIACRIVTIRHPPLLSQVQSTCGCSGLASTRLSRPTEMTSTVRPWTPTTRWQPALCPPMPCQPSHLTMASWTWWGGYFKKKKKNTPIFFLLEGVTQSSWSSF